jgi:hypothetical protein
MFLGYLADLDAKARGDHSMPGKRWPSGGVQGVAPQDPRDMAKAGLLQAQSPAASTTAVGTTPVTDTPLCPPPEPVGKATSATRSAAQRGRSRR